VKTYQLTPRIKIHFGGGNLVWLVAGQHNITLAWMGSYGVRPKWMTEPCSLHVRIAGLALTWNHPIKVITCRCGTCRMQTLRHWKFCPVCGDIVNR
jgi:hypothetical protein